MEDEADQTPSRPPIVPPVRNLSAGVSRRLAKGTLGAVPVAGAILSEVADALLPDAAEIERGRWEAEVSGGVNDAHARLDGIENGTPAAARISGLTAALAKALIEQCPDGRHRQWLEAPALAAELDAGIVAVADAIGELEMFGLVETRSLINAPLRVRLSADAYRQLDRQIMGWDTIADARRVAALALEMGSQIGTARLHQATGWEKRRFNPALAEMLGLVLDGPVSRTVVEDYPTRSFGLSPADRARLRRFVS